MTSPSAAERKFFIDNPLVRIHYVIEMIWWTGLAAWQSDSLIQVALYLPSKSYLELYRGTSRKRPPLRTYRRPMPRVLGGS